MLTTAHIQLATREFEVITRSVQTNFQRASVIKPPGKANHTIYKVRNVKVEVTIHDNGARTITAWTVQRSRQEEIFSTRFAASVELDTVADRVVQALAGEV
jgi:hypothetical protein